MTENKKGPETTGNVSEPEIVCAAYKKFFRNRCRSYKESIARRKRRRKVRIRFVPTPASLAVISVLMYLLSGVAERFLTMLGAGAAALIAAATLLAAGLALAVQE